MRLLYHHRTLAGDAQGIHIEKMIQAFKELGHHVDTVALVPSRSRNMGNPATPVSKWFDLVKKTPQWSYEFSTLAYNLVGLRLLDRAVRKTNPEFIYERYSLNTMCGILVARRYRIPLILEVNAPLRREQETLGRLSFRRLARFTERWICSNATHTIAVTDVLKNLLVEDGVPPQKLTVIHNGVDQRELHPGISGDSVRARYNLTGRTIIGFVGWFRKWHGLEMLFEAIKAQELFRHEVSVLLVGDGPAMNDLRQLVRAQNLENIVIFTGPVRREEMAEHIAAMDVALQPSTPPYACPMKIIEYMGMARCIVAPRQPNILELLDNNSSALLFDPGDITSFRSAILRSVCDREMRGEIGRKAHETLKARGYYWTRNAERTLALLPQHHES